jgi:hypothetical protein
MPTQPLHVTGRVIRQRIDRGSKSERDAVLLETVSGESFVLRRKGGPAFGDQSLNDLVGQSITVNGIEHGHLLIMQDWQSAE